MAYIKLDNQIADSSLYSVGGAEQAGVFIFLCSKANINGWTNISVPALAQGCKITVEKAQEHLGVLAGPDPYSRTAADEGRRVRIFRDPEWGIEIVNYHHFRNKDHTAAERQQRWRDRQKAKVTPVTPSHPVTSRKTKGKGQKAVGEPTVPLNAPPSSVEAGATAELLAKQYVHLFNWCFERHCHPTSEVVRKVRVALRAKTKPDEILCMPFIHAELNRNRKDKRTIEPSWLLRDGSRNTHNWIGEGLDKAGGLELGTKLSNLASVHYVAEKLRTLGVKVNPTEIKNG